MATINLFGTGGREQKGTNGVMKRKRKYTTASTEKCSRATLHTYNLEKCSTSDLAHNATEGDYGRGQYT